MTNIVTLGCRLNIAESEAIRTMVGDRAVTVVNSCAVTNEAVANTTRAIRRLRRLHPDAELVVTGCAANIEPDRYRAMPEVDRVVPNIGKLDPAHWGAVDTPPSPAKRATFTNFARAFVEVQNGCDHRCTFCAIPFGRGPSRSLPAGGVIEQIRQFVDAGHREIVLTGVDLTSYGHDLPGQPTLGQLVGRILLHVPALPRLRLSSLDGIEIDDRLFALLTQEARVMPHVHLSLQAGDDMILKRMKRRHSRAQSVALVERLKAARPAIAIGADLIAGFPTEDDAAFANTLALLDDCDVVHPHIFSFSPRTGTPAARMPQVAPALVKQRATRLREAAQSRRAAWLRSLIGTRQSILVERPGDRGHAENFAEVKSASNPIAARTGQIAPVQITDATENALTGTFA